MNFCYELYRLETRRALVRHEGRRLHILEVRQHELKVELLPERGRCRMRYYPAVGRMFISGPAGQYIGWADSLAKAFDQLALADTKQVLPGIGPLNTERSST